MQGVFYLPVRPDAVRQHLRWRVRWQAADVVADAFARLFARALANAPHAYQALQARPRFGSPLHRFWDGRDPVVALFFAAVLIAFFAVDVLACRGRLAGKVLLADTVQMAVVGLQSEHVVSALLNNLSGYGLPGQGHGLANLNAIALDTCAI